MAGDQYSARLLLITYLFGNNPQSHFLPFSFASSILELIGI